MIFQALHLAGAYLISLEPFADDRGLFARTYCRREFAAIGHEQEFVQINHSLNLHKGTLRGLHFQHPPHTEIKLIRCIQGSVYDVIVDLRAGSPTFLQHFGVELSEENMLMIYVPQGFAHGFITLEDQSALVYHHTAYYTPSAEGGLRFDDPMLQINWPMEAKILSEKDSNYTYLPSDFTGIQF